MMLESLSGIIGRDIALYHPRQKKFIQMNSEGRCLPLEKKFDDPFSLESWRNHERFRVIDAGDGEIALYCKAHHRFLRFDPSNDSINGDGGQRDEVSLPPASEWGAERFTFLHHSSDRTKWAIHGRTKNRFMRMHHHNSVDTGGGECNRDKIPSNWLAEWFQIINHPEVPPAELRVPAPYEFLHSISQVKSNLITYLFPCQGYWGITFRGIHSFDSGDYCLKMFRHNYREHMETLKNEVRNLRLLPSHPNLIQYHTSLIHEGKFFIVMEYVNGIQLNRCVPPPDGSYSEGFRLENVLSWTYQLFSGLSAIHSASIIHRSFYEKKIFLISSKETFILGISFL